MASKMEQKLRKIIREHLPGKVGVELRQVLEEHGQLKEQVEDLQVVAAERNDRISQLEHELNQHKVLDQHEAQIAEERSAVEEAKRHLEVNLLKIDLAAATRYGTKLEEFMLGLSRNLNFRRSFYGEVPVGIEKHEHSAAEAVTAKVDQTTDEEAV